jgi:hypothetical protein
MGLAFWATTATTVQGQGRNDAPTGKEIAEKAKSGALDRSAAFTHTKGDKHFTFTPVDHKSHEGKKGEVEAGVFGGTLTTETTGSGLPPGQYNLFLAKVRGDWYVYAESNGQIVKTEKVTGHPKELLESGTSGPGSAAPDKTHGPSAPDLASLYSNPRVAGLSGELVVPWNFVPYTMCFYACWWTYEGYFCGRDCEARYPFN